MNSFWVIGGGGTGAPSRWVAVIVTVPPVLPLMMKQRKVIGMIWIGVMEIRGCDWRMEK